VTSRRSTSEGLWLAVALLGIVAVSALLSLRVETIGDYEHDAGPAIRALIDGDVSAFFANQPLMGSFSLLLRAPFALLSKLSDGSELLAYRLGAFPCLVAAGLLGLHLARLMLRQGRSRALCLLVGGACLVNPVTFDALSLGHPEELLAAALCVGAALAAGRGRTIAAAVLLGLALATKQWALVAVGPVALAASADRLRLVLVSGLTVAALTLPLVAGNPGTFSDANRMAGNTPSIVGPWNVWWPVVRSEDRVIFAGTAQEKVVTVHAAPMWLRRLSHPLIVLLPLGLSLLFWRRRHDPSPRDAIALLALCFLARSMLDPVNNSYYHVPFLLSLLALEGFWGRGFPVFSAIAAAAIWTSFHAAVVTLDHGLINAYYLAWALPIGCWLAVSVFAPRALGAFGSRLRPSQPLLSR
jgi:hypothetical protein